MYHYYRVTFDAMDIFQHFERLEKEASIPTFEELFAHAKKLYLGYGTSRAYDLAMHDAEGTTEWAKTVPAGSPWIAVPTEPLVPKKKKKTPMAKPTKKKDDQAPLLRVKGDHILGQNILLIRDALISLKMSIYVAEGDVARVYECSKVISTNILWVFRKLT